MPQVCYLPDEKEVEAKAGETILQISLQSEIPHAHACGGNARCSTCRILVLHGLENCAPANEKEEALAERLHFTSEIRLACQTTVSGDVVLRRLVLDKEDEELTSQLKSRGVASAVGEEKQLAILFADIRGFTSFAESLPAYDVVHVLNRYFHLVGEPIARHGGFIDNYMGDGLMAVFGLDDVPRPALRAIRAGLEMLEVVGEMRPYMKNIYSRTFEIGIGVHYGEAVVGAIGAPETKRVTAIGDSVNLASRIEAATKQAATRFLISEDTYGEVKDEIVTGKSIRLMLAGKSGEYTLYEVTGLKGISDLKSQL